MKVGFKVKYGYNEIDIPITDETKPKYRPYGKNDKFTDKVTIYNYIVDDAVNDEHYDRFVIDKCLIYTSLGEKTDNTVSLPPDTRNVITLDVEHYKSPVDYKNLPADMKEQFYTVQVDDFIVLAEVDDVVTNELEFRQLRNKYKDNGFSVTAVQPYLKGTNTNNIHIMNV